MVTEKQVCFLNRHVYLFWICFLFLELFRDKRQCCFTIEIPLSFNAMLKWLFGAEINDGGKLLVILNRSIRLNVDARIIMGMLVSYYAYVCTRPIDRSRKLYVHARLARDNSLLGVFSEMRRIFLSFKREYRRSNVGNAFKLTFVRSSS